MTREPEWDDASRGRAMRLFEHGRSIDRETGLPIEVAYDKSQPFIVHEVTNYAQRARDRTRAEAVEKNKDRPGWDAGVHFVVETVDVPAPDERTPQ